MAPHNRHDNRGSSILEWITEHWKAILGALLTIGFTLTLVFSKNTSSNNGNGNITGDNASVTQYFYGESASSGASSAGVTQDSAPLKSNMETTPGTCLSSDGSAPCDTPHTQEVIGNASKCNKNTLIDYLDGSTMIDILSPAIHVKTQGASCIASWPQPIERSAKGIWSEEYTKEPSQFRACFIGDQASNPLAGCNEKHTGQIVYEQSKDSTGNLACERRATEFMNSEKHRWNSDLKIDDFSSADGKRYCVAKTRNDSTLDVELRDIRNNSF